MTQDLFGWIFVRTNMFEAQRLFGPTDKSLALQTRRGSNIENIVAPDPEPRNLKKYEKMRGEHPGWKNRKPACGAYNCWGHVLAARRTAIYPDAVAKMVLDEDGYHRINFVAAAVGDLVIYRGQIEGLIHVAQIVEVTFETGAVMNLPRIRALSKWDDSAGEDIHVIHDVPFKFDGPIEIWTDRP